MQARIFKSNSTYREGIDLTIRNVVMQQHVDAARPAATARMTAGADTESVSSAAGADTEDGQSTGSSSKQRLTSASSTGAGPSEGVRSATCMYVLDQHMHGPCAVTKKHLYTALQGICVVR